MSTRLTEDDVVDTFVDAVRVAWPIPVSGLGIIITAFAARLGVKPTKLQDDIVRRDKERHCCGDCEDKGCHRTEEA